MLYLLVFQTMMGLLTYRTARNFVAIRKRIGDQADEIQTQNVQLREAREEAHQAARAKVAFHATMSHEIRTPLNGVLGMTRLLSETPLSREQQDLLRTKGLHLRWQTQNECLPRIMPTGAAPGELQKVQGAFVPGVILRSTPEYMTASGRPTPMMGR